MQVIALERNYLIRKVEIKTWLIQKEGKKGDLLIKSYQITRLKKRNDYLKFT